MTSTIPTDDMSVTGSAPPAQGQENVEKKSNADAHSGDSAGEDSNAFKPDTRFWLAWTSICTIVLMAALDATSLSVALAKIAQVLNGTAIQAFWAGTSFLLTSTVFQPVIGSLSGIFGRKPLVLVSLVFFLIGTIVAGTSKADTGMGQLLVGRSTQGIGGGGIIVMSEILPTDLVPLRQRGAFLGTIGAMWAIGSVSGPLIGGALAHQNTFRWIFWINLPFLGIGGIMIILFLNLNLISGSLAEKLRRIDYVGMVTFIGSTTGILIPLSWGGVMYDWSSWRTLVPLLVSAAGFAFFVVWEEYFAHEPLIPFRITKTVNNAAVYFATVMHGLVLWCLLYYGPLYFEAVRGYTPVISGVALFPATFTIAPASIIVAIIVQKTGHYRWSIWAGFVLATLGFGLQYLFSAQSSVAQWACILLVTGLGTGLLFPGLGFGIQAASTEEDMGPAVALYTFLRTFGEAIGVAIGGVIFQNQLAKKIASHPTIASHAAEWSRDASSLVNIIKTIPQGPARDDLINSYADALKIVWVVCTVFAGLGLLASLFVKGFTLDRALQSKQQFVKSRQDSKDLETNATMQSRA